MRESGRLVVAAILRGSALSPGDSAFVGLARVVLLNHERFHFQAEVACARAEVVSGLRVYQAYFMMASRPLTKRRSQTLWRSGGFAGNPQ